MKLHSIQLTNFRCFDSLELELHPQLNVLVGMNGAGKTALLDAIAIGLGAYLDSFGATETPVFSQEDVKGKRINHDENYYSMETYFPGEVTCVVTGENLAKLQWSRVLNSAKDETIHNHAQMREWVKQLQDQLHSADKMVLPLMVYYGTGRLWEQKRKQDFTPPKKLASRTSGYINSLKPSSNYKQFEEWFIDLHYAHYAHLERNRQKLVELLPVKIEDSMDQELKPLLRALAKQLDSPDDSSSALINAVQTAVEQCVENWTKLRYDISKREIVASHHLQGDLPLSILSDGVRNMIALVADIVHRAIVLNPHFGEQAPLKTRGIVLIDEIELHLHPRWQQTILESLTKAFPNLQFIVTTHSPQVLTTVKPESIYPICWEGEQVVIAKPAFSYGAKSSDVLKEILGVDSRPDNEMTRLLRQYFDLIRQKQGNSEEARQIRIKLNEWAYGQDADLVRADMEIRRQELFNR